MSHYLGRGITVSDAVFSDMTYIKCKDCFMSHDFPIVPRKGIVPGIMEISLTFDDGNVNIAPGETFGDMKRLKGYRSMDLFCRCGGLLRSWGPDDVGFGIRRPREDYSMLKEQAGDGFLAVLYVIIRVMWSIVVGVLGF